MGPLAFCGSRLDRADHAKGEGGERKSGKSQGYGKQPGHFARPSRRHRISAPNASSTSGSTNSGQVVALSSGL